MNGKYAASGVNYAKKSFIILAAVSDNKDKETFAPGANLIKLSRS
jgi:hypothetical protein